MNDVIDETVNPCKDCPDYDAAEETCRSHGGCAAYLQPNSGIYSDMIHRIYVAYEALMKENVLANAVVINGKKYGKLSSFMFDHTYIPGPLLFGMSVGVDMKMDDDFDFMIGYFPNPPKTEYDKLKADYDRLKKQYDALREAMGRVEEIVEGYY